MSLVGRGLASLYEPGSTFLPTNHAPRNLTTWEHKTKHKKKEIAVCSNIPPYPVSVQLMNQTECCCMR